MMAMVVKITTLLIYVFYICCLYVINGWMVWMDYFFEALLRLDPSAQTVSDSDNLCDVCWSAVRRES